MSLRSLQSQVTRLERDFRTLVAALPGERELKRYIDLHRDEDLLAIAALWAPVVLLGMRRKGYGDPQSYDDVRSYMEELARRVGGSSALDRPGAKERSEGGSLPATLNDTLTQPGVHDEDIFWWERKDS